MITIGNVETSERLRALEASIVAFVEGDVARRAWFGGGPGCDFLAVELEDRLGQTWLMGRVRLHVDEALHGSDDVKQSVCVGVARGTPEDERAAALAIPIVAAGTVYGIQLARAEGEARTPEALMDLIQEAVTATPHGRFSKLQVPKDSKVPEDLGYKVPRTAP